MSSFLKNVSDSSARKFVTSDSIQNNPVTDATNNVEHIIDLASGLKAAAVSVQSIATQARAAAEQVTQALAQVSGNADPLIRPPAREYDDTDVVERQHRLTQQIIRDFTGVDDRQVRTRLEGSAQNLIDSSLTQFTTIRQDSTATTVNACIPEIESLMVDLDVRRGASDIFYTRLTFNLPADLVDGVRAIRIFRCTVQDPIYVRPLATLSSHGIERLSSLTSIGSSDPTITFQQRLSENGIPNAIDKLNPLDPYTNLRAAVNGTGTFDISPPLAGQGLGSVIDANVPTELRHLDSSVTQDVSVLANIRRNPLFTSGSQGSPGDIQVGTNVNTGLLLGSAQQQQIFANASTTTLVVDQNNVLDFQEIAFLSPDRFGGRRIGNRMEYVFDDETVTYGLGYRYFIATVDSGMNQSSRSSIASVVVEGLRIPPRPSNVSSAVEQNQVVLTILVDDCLVEKFEVYRKEDDPNRLESVEATTISDDVGFTVTKQTRTIMDNGFLLIGESLNPLRGGSTFTDPVVGPGRRYVYRVYSVDIFGNKSESPCEIDAYIPDRVQKYLNLKKPTILAEVDATTLKVRVTFNCEDPLVETLWLDRRDLTLGQESFSTPSQPPRTVMGMYHPLRGNSLLGERMFNQEAGVTWNGVFQNDQRQQVFIDFTTTFDHIYQYRIVGQDRYGNQTSYEVSRPVLAVRRPFINVPLNMSSSLRQTANGANVGAVIISWSESNLDKAAEELIGDQAALSSSQIRTLYQVERKKAGEEIWQRFSLITGTSLVDPTVVASGTVAPNYRPPYLEINTDYLYRVQAVQTGAFISNFTDPLSVFVGFPVASPSGFTLRVPPVYTRPFYVMLNWDTPDNTGVVDHWEIERAEVNNLAASRLNLKNPSDFNNVTYVPFRKVYREASRFLAKVYDKDRGLVNKNLIQGQSYYMDTMVEFGNTYFYRIRAISPQGQMSGWTYRGIKITSAVFEGKWGPLMTDREKRSLSNSYSPMRLRMGPRPIQKNTFSLQPGYSKPVSLRIDPLPADPEEK